MLSKNSFTEQIGGSDLEWCRVALRYCTNDKNFRISHPFTSRQMIPTYKRITNMCRRIDGKKKEINNSLRDIYAPCNMMN